MEPNLVTWLRHIFCCSCSSRNYSWQIACTFPLIMTFLNLSQHSPTSARHHNERIQNELSPIFSFHCSHWIYISTTNCRNPTTSKTLTIPLVHQQYSLYNRYEVSLMDLYSTTVDTNHDLPLRWNIYSKLIFSVFLKNRYNQSVTIQHCKIFVQNIVLILLSTLHIPPHLGLPYLPFAMCRNK